MQGHVRFGIVQLWLITNHYIVNLHLHHLNSDREVYTFKSIAETGTISSTGVVTYNDSNRSPLLSISTDPLLCDKSGNSERFQNNANLCVSFDEYLWHR